MAQNKIALLTGGNRGIGENIALNLAKKGIDVILTYNTQKEKANDVVSEIEQLGQKAVALQLDIANMNSFDSFLVNLKTILKKTFHSSYIDFLINNAGMGILASFAETTEAQFDIQMNVLFKGVFFLSQKILPITADGGCIINISTNLTRFSYPGYSAYSAMKGALEVMTFYQAKELGHRRIRANSVAPGAIETDFRGGEVRDNKELNDAIASLTALGRVGTPDDIGGVVTFLCSEEAKWINGQRIEVSGGIML